MKQNVKIICNIGFLICIFLFLMCISVKHIGTDEKDIVQHRMQWYLNRLFDGDSPLMYLGDKKVSIAIIDSGIDDTHLDLVDAVKDKYVVTSLDENANDDYGHGTFVCGIIAGYPNNHDGILGINSNVDILSIDVSDENDLVEIVGMIEAIEYAINMNVDIINLSIMTKTDYKELHNVIKKAYEQGIIIVAASGNDTDEKCGYPAGYEEVLSIGAYTKSGEIMYSELDNTIYLPGKNIVSTSYGSDLYASRDGTSVATPMMTGIISLILSHKDLSNNDIMNYFSNYNGKKITSVNKIFNDLKISY